MVFNKLNTFMDDQFILEFQRRIVALGFPKEEKYTLNDLFFDISLSEDELNRYVNGYYTDKKNLDTVIMWLSDKECEYVKYRNRLDISFPYVDFSKIVKDKITNPKHSEIKYYGLEFTNEMTSKINEYSMYDEKINATDDGFYKTQIKSNIVLKKNVDGYVKNIIKDKQDSNKGSFNYLTTLRKKVQNFDMVREAITYV